jgi:hypothetical protein
MKTAYSCIFSIMRPAHVYPYVLTCIPYAFPRHSHFIFSGFAGISRCYEEITGKLIPPLTLRVEGADATLQGYLCKDQIIKNSLDPIVFPTQDIDADHMTGEQYTTLETHLSKYKKDGVEIDGEVIQGEE